MVSGSSFLILFSAYTAAIKVMGHSTEGIEIAQG